MYRENVSKGLVGGIYKGSIYMTQGTSEDHIRSRPKVCSSILGSIYSETKNLNSDFNSILSINRRTNGETKLDIRIVFTTLCQLHTEQLGIIITSYIVYKQYNTIKGNQ